MHNGLRFTTFDPVRDAPDLCQLCGTRPPVFHFETTERLKGDSPRKGFCCHVCATRLLRTLELTESQEWTAEEAALAADDFDIAEFHKRLESLRAVIKSS